jgi:uncharacterized membrane protein
MNNTPTLEYESASSTVKVLSILNLIIIEIIGNFLLGGIIHFEDLHIYIKIATLLSATLRYATLRYATLRYATLRYATSRFP